MISIYNKQGKFKVTLNYTIEEFEPSWYDEWEEGDVISATKLTNPVIDNGMVREMTREECVEAGINITLNAGEYIEDRKIKIIEQPSNLIRAVWDSEKHEWKEGMTKEELMLKRKDLIMQYKELKVEIETLEEFAEEFESDNTVELLKSKMAKIKEEINNLLQVIKKM